MDELILKYLRGELSLEEQHRFTRWLEEDESQREIISKFERYWKNGQQNFSKESVEVLENIRDRISNREYIIEPTRIIWMKYLKYAAVFLLVSLSTLFVHHSFEGQNQEMVVRLIEKSSLSGQKITVKLSDGSVVKLNAESKLIVPEIFGANNRQVELIGEAFFDIVPDPSRPFNIKVQDMSIEVLGTSFNVRSYQDEPDQRVSVRTGKVLVKNTTTGDAINLLPNELSIFNKDQGQLVKKSIENKALAFGWMDQKIVFENEPVSGVLNTLSKWYGVKIKTSKEFPKEKLYTANHDNPTLKEVLINLAFVYDFEFKIENNEVKIN